jgi:hypothetical protein
MPSIKEIVKKYLEDNGFDGLFNPGECSCENEDLTPCQSPNEDTCSAGYKVPCPSYCGEHDFHIQEEKIAELESINKNVNEVIMKNKMRLIFRFAVVDSDAKCAGYEFITEVIECPESVKVVIGRWDGQHPEVVGCEWIEEEER